MKFVTGPNGHEQRPDARRFGREILDAVPGGAIIAFDVQMRISFAEGDELQRRGHEAGSLRGRLLSEVLPPDSWATVKEPYARALRGETVHFETHREETTYSVRVSPVIEEGRIVGAIAVAHSVSEQKRLVAESPAPRDNIIFEITETAVAENLNSARRFAERLREMGCSFALDDFGVGFGTFTYLKHLPVDYLKIDIEFVRDLLRDDTDRHVVSAIVAAAELFGMKTIAEGVEDQETQDILLGMGVDFAQGYWIGRPIPVAELWDDSFTIETSRST